jgi:CubicO group peptidase (beta-lactamase class C family)
MKYFLISFFIFFVGYSSAWAQKQPDKKNSGKKTQALKSKKEKKLSFNTLIKEAERLNSGTLLITKNGKFVVEKNWESPLSYYYLQGITPSVVTLAIGSVLDEGKLQLEGLLSQWIPEWIDQKGQIKVLQLLNQTSGFADDEKDPWYKNPNSWAWVRLQNPKTDPGTFTYSDTNFVLLGLAVSKTLDKPVEELVVKRIFEPLKIQKWGWDKDKTDHSNVAGGLRLRNYDLLKIGNLVADNGKWNGKKIISQEWLDQIRKPSESNPNYGLGWWLHEAAGVKAWHAYGYQGQHLVIIPEQKIVALRLRSLVPVEQNKEEYDWIDFPKQILEITK